MYSEIGTLVNYSVRKVMHALPSEPIVHVLKISLYTNKFIQNNKDVFINSADDDCHVDSDNKYDRPMFS